MASLWASARQASVPFLKVPPSSSKGAARGPYESGVAQCYGSDTALTSQCRTVVGMALPGGLAEQHRDMIPKRVRGTTWRGFAFDLGVCMCQKIKCSGRGSGEPVRASSEAESRSRGCLALERDGVSPEGASSPRARRSLARGGVQPSSEAESY
jgi:hypothetical protein